MTMTKDELANLPQSAFKARLLQGWAVCGMCGAKMAGRDTAYVKECATALYEYLCPTCYATHPAEAAPERRFFIDLSPERQLVACPPGARFFKDGRTELTSLSVKWFERHAVRYREIPASEARDWAREHGHFEALFGEEPETWPKFFVDQHCIVRATSDDDGTFITPGHTDPNPTDGAQHHRDPDYKYEEVTEAAARSTAKERGHDWPSEWGAPAEPKAEPEPEWQYGRDSADGKLYRWMGDASRYQWMHNRGTWGESSTIGGYPHRKCIDGDGEYSLITEQQAIAYAREWGSKWAEEKGGKAETLIGADGPYKATEASFKKPAPSDPHPVGYSCRECGGMLQRTTSSDGRKVEWGCPHCHLAWWPGASPKPYAWVQPGPPPGPWEEEWEWSGEERPPVQGEWYIRRNKGRECEAKQAECDGSLNCVRHILRPKPKPAETPAYEGDPADAAFITTKEPGTAHWCGSCIDSICKHAGTDTSYTCLHHNDEQPTPSGKDLTMQATIAKFHSKPKCPKCRDDMYASIGYMLEDDGMLHATCGGCQVKLVMPPADAKAEPRSRRSPVAWVGAKTAWLALKYVRFAGFFGTVVTGVAGLAGLKMLGYPQPLAWAKEGIAALTTALIG